MSGRIDIVMLRISIQVKNWIKIPAPAVIVTVGQSHSSCL